MKERIIFHVDINNCYASISSLFRPELVGKPVAVGGDVEERHGIILAKNYEAKPYGIKVGEAIWQAKQKCPGLIVIPPEYDLYQRYSRLIRSIFFDYTDLIEPFGLDEAWLDVTGSLHLFCGDAYHLADRIRQRVKQELGITVSIGISFNKTFAKLGSDMKKPDAVTLITRENYRNLVWPLPVEDLLYVGRATKAKLHSRGIHKIGELAILPLEVLQSWFGKWGYILHGFANGEDFSNVKAVNAVSQVESIGNSITAPRDLCNLTDVKIVLWNLCQSVGERMRELGLMCNTVQVSFRDNNLMGFDRQKKLVQPTNLSREIFYAAVDLVVANYDFKTPLRGIGARAMNLMPAGGCKQLSMLSDEVERQKQLRLEQTLDQLRRRFGHHCIDVAQVLTDPTLPPFDAKGEHTIHPVGYFS